MEKLMITAPIIAEDHGDQWSSLSGITFTADEEAEATFMAQLFNTTTTIPSADPNFMAPPSHLHNNNLLHFETPSSSSSSSSSSASYTLSQLFLFPTTANNNDHYFHYCNNNPMNNIHHFSLGDDQLGNYNNSAGFHLQDDQDSMNLEVSESHLQLQPCNSSEVEFIKLPEQAAMEEEEDQGHVNQLEIINVGKKRSRGSGDVQKRGNERSKKTLKLIISSSNNTEEDGHNAGHSRQSTSSHCSEDESANASLELDGGANDSGSNPKGPTKSRASRGSATDPQSLYARRRRERINERLKILQNLVPNGTKVDISTMLEEAVEYVKFLQLQIKLLSSDDLWMYAPIAYNGMDIGLNPTTHTAKES